MTYVISRLCRDCKDQSCVEVCPVECIFQYTGEDPNIPKGQLLIDPQICIDCAACEPTCPWEAIFPVHSLPALFLEDQGINARIVGQADRVIPLRDPAQPQPTGEQVVANKQKWGFG